MFLFKIIGWLFKLVGYLLALVFFAAAGLLATAGYWMPVSDEPAQAQAILVLAGSATRPMYAAELYEQGLAPMVYVSRPARTRDEALMDDSNVFFPKQEDIYAQILQTQGVPINAVSYFGEDSASTVEEAEAAAKLFGADPGTLIVVTSPSNQLRTKMIFEKAMPNHTVLVLGTPHDPLPKYWWNDREATRQVFVEFGKITYHFVGGWLGADSSSSGSEQENSGQEARRAPLGGNAS
ncbi:MAG: YdcF family protein [Desulfovibrio sp.]|nr:MAG: YdcF family protein [Desulfovibrio sp.]